MLGIFDGHGGSEAVDYVVRCLPASISYWLHREGSGGLQADLGKVLRRAFHDVNAGFTDLLFDRQRSTSTRVDDISVDVTSRRLRHCGTTATVCLLRQTTADSTSTTQGASVTELTVGHVGDTRAFLATSERDKGVSVVRQLTDDHRPGLPGETERIVSCDGHVTEAGGSHGASARVNGILEMTRSIGDVGLKRYGVTAEPAIYTATLASERDSFLALVTDGVHSSMSTEQLSALVADCTESSEAARSIVETAILAGSRDNCTALVLPLGAWRQTRREAAVAPRVISFSDGRTAFGDLGLGFQF
jgi:protein phosphatase 1K